MDQNDPIENSQNTPDRDRDKTMTIELGARAASAKSLDEISFLLTNDLRTLSNFDRCFLITHFGSSSRITAATHQPILAKNTEIETNLIEVASLVSNVQQPIVLSNFNSKKNTPDEKINYELRSALELYINRAGSIHICIIPLIYNDTIVAHLLMEYFADNVPQKQPLMLTMKLAPVFAAMLTGRWLFEKKPRLVDYVRWKSTLGITPGKRFARYIIPIAAICALLFMVFLVIPFDVFVGGEAIIDPREKQYAFCKLGGLLDEVYVNQGSHVEKGQVLARLDTKELDHKIKREERRFEILTQDIALLQTKAIDDPSTIARSKLLELERKNVSEELQYLKWQRQYLEIKSPVDGIVVTRDVETLTGKRLEPGEPFCEIAKPGLLAVNVFVPDERIMEVSPGQTVFIYLDSNPRKPYQLKVDEIAPRSEVQPRLGNVYRVTAEFESTPSSIKVGMKGVGKIHTGTASLWYLLEKRIRTRLNQLSLYFW